MKFQVPESERDKLAKLVQLSPEKLDLLSERLSTASPKLRASDLVKELHLPSDDENDAVDVSEQMKPSRGVDELPRHGDDLTTQGPVVDVEGHRL